VGKRIVVDPITRIEGHLRIEVEVEGGKVKDAWSSGTMWRGLEIILQGRDPNDAWFITQRTCGVCTTVHAIASVRAVENALGIGIPLTAQYIRNLIIIAHTLHDHIVHFYHLSAVDWVDVVSAIKADPKKASALAESLSDWPHNGEKDFAAVQEQLKGFVDKGKLGIFNNGYWGHPAMKLSPEVNLIAVAHYLQALEYQRYATNACAILGGKTPHIQNLVVGGVTNGVNSEDDSTLNVERLYYVKELLDKVKTFVNKVYLPDVAAVGIHYPEWLDSKMSGGVMNYLAVPELPLDSLGKKFDLPGGTIINGDLGSVKPITSFNDKYLFDNVFENTSHAWYKDKGTLHPYEGKSDPDYKDWKDNVPEGDYSWVKAPRFKVGDKYVPMQVGPAAQVLVGFALKHEPTVKWATAALKLVNETHLKLIGSDPKLGPNILMSTLGRHVARCIRAQIFTDLVDKHWALLVEQVGKGNNEVVTHFTYPKGTIYGMGFHEAPRGFLSHWIVIENGKIKNYQQVVPSTWNAGPRDDKNARGPYEEALVNNPIADPEKPLEVLRTIHSFDPCLACAIHLFDPDGEEISQVKVL
jgi:hydrogenase large subunit